MNKLGLLFLVILSMGLLVIVRTGESIRCAPAESSIICQSSERHLLYSTDQNITIPNRQSIRISFATTTTSAHAPINMSVIEALDLKNERKVLLHIPEREMGYASELVRRIESLQPSDNQTVEFERDEYGTLFMILGAELLFWSVYAVLSIWQKRRSAAKVRGS